MNPAFLLLVLLVAGANAFQFAPSYRTNACASSAIVMRARKKKEVAPASPADAIDVEVPADVAEAVAALADEEEVVAEAVVPEPVKMPEITMPEINIDAEKIEDGIVLAIKAFKGVFDTAVKINEEHDLVGKAKDAAIKAKDAAKAVVEFEKENELLLKARATVELTAAEAKKVSAKAATPKVTPPTPEPSKKPKFELPTIEMPTFKK